MRELTKEELEQRDLEYRFAYKYGFEAGYRSAMGTDEFVRNLLDFMDPKVTANIGEWCERKFKEKGSPGPSKEKETPAPAIEAPPGEAREADDKDPEPDWGATGAVLVTTAAFTENFGELLGGLQQDVVIEKHESEGFLYAHAMSVNKPEHKGDMKAFEVAIGTLSGFSFKHATDRTFNADQDQLNKKGKHAPDKGPKGAG